VWKCLVASAFAVLLLGLRVQPAHSAPAREPSEKTAIGCAERGERVVVPRAEAGTLVAAAPLIGRTAIAERAAFARVIAQKHASASFSRLCAGASRSLGMTWRRSIPRLETGEPPGGRAAP